MKSEILNPQAVTRVVNFKKEPFDIYIGRKVRGMHFGNPFSHLEYGLGVIKVESRKEAVIRFDYWLHGMSDLDVEQSRRAWILEQIPNIRGKVLGCYCSPKACHGDILARIADGLF